MAPTVLPKVTAFISYSHADREYGGQARRVLAEVGIDAFLAHEDLVTSEEWKQRILDELRHCDLFVPILSKSFLNSLWAPQEAGFIASRPEVVIAPLSIDGTTPFGFFGHLQSGRVLSDGVTREVLVEPLARKFPRKILPGLIKIAADAGSFRSAEAKLGSLVPFFQLFTKEEAEALAEGAVANGQIWSAGRCRGEYLPEFISVQKHNIAPDTLRALEYQVEHDEWYRDTDSTEA